MERAMSALETARHKQRWSLEEAAQRIGVDRATLSRWEKGESKPRAVNLRRLCDVYGMSPQELGFGDDDDMMKSGAQTGDGEAIREHIAGNLKLRLSALIFAPLTEFQVLHSIMLSMIEETTMNMEFAQAQRTRREALRELAVLPLMALNLTSFSQGKPRLNMARAGDILAQCTAGVAACEELSKGNDHSDLLLAYDGLSKYFPVLKVIVKDSSSQLRKMATSLAAQAARIQALLSWHLHGAREALQYGKEAVELARETEDTILIIDTLSYLTWVYYYAGQYKTAYNTSRHAYSLLQRDTPPQLQSCICAYTAVMGAKQGQRDTTPLRKAARIFPTGEHETYGEFGQSSLVLDDGMTHYYWGDYDKALDSLNQLIDADTLALKMPLPERTRLEGLNFMALSSLKSKDRDMERIIHIWTEAITKAKALRSEQRFNEACYIYDVFEVIWPGEVRIADLREYIVHW